MDIKEIRDNLSQFKIPKNQISSKGGRPYIKWSYALGIILSNSSTNVNISTIAKIISLKGFNMSAKIGSKASKTMFPPFNLELIIIVLSLFIIVCVLR